MNKLTDKQQKVLDFVVKYITENGYAPSREDIALELGFASSNAANDHLRALERKRRIKIADGVARGIRVLEVDNDCD